MDMGKVEDWLSAVPSKYTRKIYKAGIRKFEEFYQQGIETLIGQSPEETGHVIDKFYTWLKDRGHGQNTCRNLVNSPIQFLKFFGTDPKYKRSLGIYRTVLTTRDHRTSIGEIQEMAKTANTREQVLFEDALTLCSEDHASFGKRYIVYWLTLCHQESKSDYRIPDI